MGFHWHSSVPGSADGERRTARFPTTMPPVVRVADGPRMTGFLGGSAHALRAGADVVGQLNHACDLHRQVARFSQRYVADTGR